jgi:hypothetical protein
VKGYGLPIVGIQPKGRAHGIPKAKGIGGMIDVVLKHKKMVPSPS